jgi:hypothetical protein
LAAGVKDAEHLLRIAAVFVAGIFAFLGVRAFLVPRSFGEYGHYRKGLTTACCEACPTGARQLVDLKNPKDPIHEFLKTHSVQVLKPHLATGAKAFYNGLDGSVR